MNSDDFSCPQFVAYYRVSTDKQGRSGLGLEAQTATVATYVGRNQGELLASFQEVESGKRDDRTELLEALALCKKKKAILVIAKLDRLSRNLAFIANLMDGKVPFVACDMPQANQLTIHIMAAMAQHEREETSRRTKDALKAAKARGQKLGSPRPGNVQATAARIEQTRQFRETVLPVARELRERGLTLRAIADEMNKRRIETCNDRVWYAASVGRLLKKMD